MRTVASKLGSHRVAIFEALAENLETGLTIPEIGRASGVPKSTVHRVIADFVARGIVVKVGKRHKAPILHLNPADDESIDLADVLTDYTLRRARAEARKHGLDDFANGHSVTVLNLYSMKKSAEPRHQWVTV